MLSLSMEDDNGMNKLILAEDGCVVIHNYNKTTLYQLNASNRQWLTDYLRNSTLFLLPQIVQVLRTPRDDFNDVKRELVKL